MSTTVAALELASKERREAVTSINRLSAFFAQLEGQLESIQPVPLAPVLAHKVTDVASKDIASKFKAAIKEHMSTVSGILAEPKATAFKLHKTFTGLENFLLAEDVAAMDHLDKQVRAFVAEEDRKRIALEAALRQQQEAAARQALADAEAARQQALMEALPFLDEPEPPPVVPESFVAAPITVADSFAGSKVNKPWSAEVFDLKALCLAVAEGRCDAECITVNQTYLNSAARLYKDRLSERFPGVKGVQATRVKY